MTSAPPPAAQTHLPGPWLEAARQVAGAQQYPPAALYVVATPIGNLADLTLRAAHVLALADAVACEDSRVGGGLLRHLGLHKPLLSVHAHNEAEAAAGVVQRLAQGQRVAYISDAGTPGVSDPGARLVAAVAAAGHRVVPLPGPSSVTAALSVAGDALGQGFRFAGFVPARGAERGAALQRCADDAGTVVLFEAPHRVAPLLHELAVRCPQRRITLCRELTKQFETVVHDHAAALPAWLAADPQRSRGEFVLVLHAMPAPAPAGATLPAPADALLQALLAAGTPLKGAATLVADATGLPRNALYARGLELKDGSDAGS